jgi:hypothetical protein
MWRTIYARRILIIFLVFSASNQHVSAQDKATQQAEKIAEKVKQKAQASEKAEGRQDLVKDNVTIKKGKDAASRRAAWRSIILWRRLSRKENCRRRKI